jgi:hypothetical protein
MPVDYVLSHELAHLRERSGGCWAASCRTSTGGKLNWHEWGVVQIYGSGLAPLDSGTTGDLSSAKAAIDEQRDRRQAQQGGYYVVGGTR